MRRAIEWGVDRDGVNKTVFNGLMKTAWSPLMRPTLGYDPSTEKVYRYDPARAKQLLEEAGWRPGADGIREKAGQKLSLNFLIIGRTRDKAMAESIQASLRDVGIDIQVNALERAAFVLLQRSVAAIGTELALRVPDDAPPFAGVTVARGEMMPVVIRPRLARPFLRFRSHRMHLGISRREVK